MVLFIGNKDKQLLDSFEHGNEMRLKSNNPQWGLLDAHNESYVGIYDLP